MSGYAYKEWKGSFYPADLPAEAMLDHYATRFPAVEINNTFYRMPKEATVLDWASRVPDGFQFAVKASRRITHDNRLLDAGSMVDYLVGKVALLGGKQGPLLFQLPPNFSKDLPRLEAFLPLLPPEWRIALEWRHPSWNDKDVLAALERHGVAAVAIEQEGDDAAPELTATAPWGYVRLHRPGYTPLELRQRADAILAQPWSDCYVFFKHEEEIAGPAMAQGFSSLIPAEA